MGIRRLNPTQAASFLSPSRMWEARSKRGPNQSYSQSPHPLWLRWGDGHKLSVPLKREG